MLISRRRCLSQDTRRGRSLTQRKRNKRLQSAAMLSRNLWTCKFCQKSKLLLSYRAICALCFLSQMGFTHKVMLSSFYKVLNN
uniref:Uncharacterized protein n=1 Tax=Suricata suricatta TaxID=37032 RepID=A0A673VF93_SURSU